MEYRIEDLARTGGVAVDTIRFYQGKGLLPAPRRQGRFTLYNGVHLERLQRIRDLQQRGFSLTVIRRFLEGELESSDESLVAAITAPPPPQTLSLAELAERSGIALPLLRELERARLLVPESSADSDEPRYPARDVAAISAGLKVLEAGIPLGELMALAAELAAAIDTTAHKAVELFDHHVRERIQSEAGSPAEVEAALLDLFNQLLDASGLMVRHHFERTLLRAAREHVERLRDRASTTSSEK